MRYMLDTNICIYAIKNRPPEVIARLKQHDPSEICISSVVYSELMYGAEKSQAVEKNRLAIMLMLANIEIIDFDALAAERTGRVRATLARRGTPICPMDAMIAGHALALGYTVVTNNTREFARVDDLRLENWAQ